MQLPLVCYFTAQEVVEIIHKNFLLSQMWPQEKAGSVHGECGSMPIDNQERFRTGCTEFLVEHEGFQATVMSRSYFLLCCSAWNCISACAAPVCTFSLFVLDFDVSNTKNKQNSTVLCANINNSDELEIIFNVQHDHSKSIVC